jgi:Ca2+-binding EF-hand superfamily protein
MKTKILMAAIAAGVLATTLSAQEAGRPGGPEERPNFAALDADGDGLVTLEEMQASAAARFVMADTNGDGGLSADELIAQMQARRAAIEADIAAQMLERLDANNDGLLQADELQQRGGDRLERMFARLDANDDGSISQEEFDAVKDRFGNHGPRDHGEHGEHGERGHGGMGGLFGRG